MGPIRAKKGPKRGFKPFFVQNALNFADAVYYDHE